MSWCMRVTVTKSQKVDSSLRELLSPQNVVVTGAATRDSSDSLP